MSLLVSHPTHPSVRLVLSVFCLYVYVHTSTPVTGSNRLFDDSWNWFCLLFYDYDLTVRQQR